MRILIGSLGRVLSFIIFHSPVTMRRGLGRLLAWLWFDVFRIRRQTVLHNLQIAFPEMTEHDRLCMARESIRSLGLNFVEYSLLPWLNQSNFNDHFVFKNPGLVDEALGRGKGVLMLTLHLGHGDLACAAMSLRGWPIVMVSKFFKLKWLNDLWFGMRERLGTKFIPPRDSSFALLRALKNKAAVVIPLDQFTGPPIGVRTKFFGRETGTAAGLAVMASRSGAPVLAVYTYRDPEGRHVLCFEREMPVHVTKDPESITQVTQSFNDQLESFVRRHPEQWMWIHRRWKTYVVT
jgi:Kdo2-lipid IVA lauroyltransferase/acyltransferase